MFELRKHRSTIAYTLSAGLLTLSACSGASTASTAAVDEASTAASAVFDSSYVHDISIEFDTADYNAMIDAYVTAGDKKWIEATVTIDGSTYQSAGIRLKGNSSLFGLAGGPGPSGRLSADDPAELPWLIRLDKYVDGQNHHGVNDLVVRSNNSETALNEAVALDLLDAAGLASQDAMAVRFSANSSDEVLRLVIEHPDDLWMADALDASGVLYKAESTGDYSYRGDEPDAYDEVFDQEAGKDNADLTPLIEFLDFINNSDDTTFEAEIGERLEVDAFATYLAMQDIVQNFDDIDGPGNNSYLFYDTHTGQFTVVPWDHNLAFGDAGFGPEAGPVGAPPAFGLDGDRPEPPAGFEPGRRPDRAEGVGGPGASNVLVNRMLALDDFSTLYHERVAELTASLIESGIAADTVATWVEVLERDATDLVSAAIITSEAARLSQSF